MEVVEAGFLVLGVLVGAFVALVGLTVVLAIWWIDRRSVTTMPDDTAVAAGWERHGIAPVPDGDLPLLDAAMRIHEGAVDEGHEILGLPGPHGIRLCGRGEAADGRPFWVADVFNLNSVSSTGQRVTSATVQLRAVAAVPLERDAPHVIVATSNRAMRVLADASGLPEVELESGRFNKAFHVRAESVEAAYAVLTPQVVDALTRHGRRFALEFGDRLATLVEVSGRGGVPALGQVGCLDDLVAAARAIAAGTREHTWPEPTGAERWWPDRVTRREPDDLVVDPRPPGADHPEAPRGRGANVAVAVVGFAFLAAGIFGIAASL